MAQPGAQHGRNPHGRTGTRQGGAATPFGRMTETPVSRRDHSPWPRRGSRRPHGGRSGNAACPLVKTSSPE
jgi:hypothetical protein